MTNISKSSAGPNTLRLTPMQRILVLANLPARMAKMRRHDFFSVLEAIFYIVKTGCQWNMLPEGFPPYQSVYHHFRSWTAAGWMETLLKVLVEGRRGALGDEPGPKTGIIDSQSVRSCLPQSEKGIDGHKRIKGIKRSVMADSHGWPMAAVAATANTQDSKAAIPLIAKAKTLYPDLCDLKADKGYAGSLQRILPECLGLEIQCVKSNFGTPDFIPLEGRWVVEALFSWLSNYRRLPRNYEKYLDTARGMTLIACVMFMLRFFR